VIWFLGKLPGDGKPTLEVWGELQLGGGGGISKAWSRGWAFRWGHCVVAFCCLLLVYRRLSRRREEAEGESVGRTNRSMRGRGGRCRRRRRGRRRRSVSVLSPLIRGRHNGIGRDGPSIRRGSGAARSSSPPPESVRLLRVWPERHGPLLLLLLRKRGGCGDGRYGRELGGRSLPLQWICRCIILCGVGCCRRGRWPFP